MVSEGRRSMRRTCAQHFLSGFQALPTGYQRISTLLSLGHESLGGFDLDQTDAD
jgi:hypothetical protein